jgi:diaminopimelate decarboxylase
LPGGFLPSKAGRQSYQYHPGKQLFGEVSKRNAVFYIYKQRKFSYHGVVLQTKGRHRPMKKPFVTLEQLTEIAAKYPTPFHLYDERGIRENARKLHRAFAWNPGFKEYFAVKATPNPAILKILQDEDCGVDCSSLTELMLSDRCGFRGSDIMFSSNDTPPEEFVLARKLGAIINLDDFTHIDFLKRVAGIPEVISCRYNPGGHFSISNEIMDNPGDAKYGFTRPQLTEGFRALKALGVKQFGIHAFLASNTISNAYYPTLAGVLFQTAVELKEETGADIRFINLSGGIGIPYHPDQKANDILAIGEGVRQKYEEVLVPAGMGDVAIYTELGRFMLGPYGCLVTAASHEKHIYKEYIGVDACAADLMRPAMYGAYHHITVMGKEDQPRDHKYDITGALCENNDKFAIDRMLPKIDLGDLLVLHDTGAHGYAMGYNYNGRLRSAEVLLQEDGSTRLIRRAETPEDYFATMIFD